MDKLEKIAREICKSQGHNPDERVFIQAVPVLGAKGRIVIPRDEEIAPAWVLYTIEARAAMRATADQT